MGATCGANATDVEATAANATASVDTSSNSTDTSSSSSSTSNNNGGGKKNKNNNNGGNNDNIIAEVITIVDGLIGKREAEIQSKKENVVRKRSPRDYHRRAY